MDHPHPHAGLSFHFSRNIFNGTPPWITAMQALFNTSHQYLLEFSLFFTQLNIKKNKLNVNSETACRKQSKLFVV